MGDATAPRRLVTAVVSGGEGAGQWGGGAQGECVLELCGERRGGRVLGSDAAQGQAKTRPRVSSGTQ